MYENLDEMTKNFLHELDGMAPEKIEQLRTEWVKEIANRKAELKSFEGVTDYVNAVCDVAISRAKKRLAVA